jgi:uncharacterized protein with von Willebrand factor type A (vWA) domain
MKNSIEYLINEVSEILTDTHLNSMQYLLLADALKRAKEMYKNEIIKAHGIKGWYKPEDKTSGTTTGEEYYNQLYNQNK